MLFCTSRQNHGAGPPRHCVRLQPVGETLPGADEVRDEVRVTIEQHALLAGAFPKFGFEGSVGI